MPHRSSRRTGAFSPSLFGDGWAVFLRFAPHSRPLGAHSGHSPNGGSAFSVDCRDTAFPTVRQSGDYARVKGRCRHEKANFIVLSAKTARKTLFVPVLRQPFVRPCAGNWRLPSAKRRSPLIGFPSAATVPGVNFPSRRTAPPPPLLANALSLCPAAPRRLRSLSPIVFPLLSCPNFFSPACCSVRPW